MKKIILITFTCFLFFSAWAQNPKSRAKLEYEKKQNLKKIIQVKKILSQTIKEKQSTLGDIKAINQQIINQQIKIDLAKEDIELIKLEMLEIKKAQSDLFKELKVLQSEYSETIYRASKNSSKLTKMGFLFSASSFSDLFIRYKYLEQYSESRKQQLLQIKKIGAMLKERHGKLLTKKMTQQNLIAVVKIENKNLEALKEQQTLIVSNLSEKEGELKTELQKSKAALSQLNSIIVNAIAEQKSTRKTPESLTERQKEIAEREKQILADRRKANQKNDAKSPEKSENETRPKKIEIATNSYFEKQKSRLPWPANGFVSDKFGVKNHPVLKNLKIDNNGIDIQTEANAPVSAVYEGIVLDIREIPGLNNVVAIQHGDYYTVYANLESVNVNINEKVSIMQQIGRVAYKEGSPEINFQIWHNFDKLNPEPWLGTK
jgi:septal ring factor EnvC (AmiA/AmiB activator)